MAKKKAPAPKRSGKKKCAPKKAVKSKPIPQQVVEQSARARAGRKASALPHVDVSAPSQKAADEIFAVSGFQSATPTFDDRKHGAVAFDHELPAPPPPGPKSKWWRQYQNTVTGEFIGWLAAAKLTKDKVISRLRLRKPAR